MAVYEGVETLHANTIHNTCSPTTHVASLTLQRKLGVQCPAQEAGQPTLFQVLGCFMYVSSRFFPRSLFQVVSGMTIAASFHAACRPCRAMCSRPLAPHLAVPLSA